jgi:hypothetical protein
VGCFIRQKFVAVVTSWMRLSTAGGRGRMRSTSALRAHLSINPGGDEELID